MRRELLALVRLSDAGRRESAFAAVLRSVRADCDEGLSRTSVLVRLRQCSEPRPDSA